MIASARHTEITLVLLGMFGIGATAWSIATDPILWYHWLAFAAFSSLIPLSSLFRGKD